MITELMMELYDQLLGDQRNEVVVFDIDINNENNIDNLSTFSTKSLVISYFRSLFKSGINDNINGNINDNINDDPDAKSSQFILDPNRY